MKIGKEQHRLMVGAVKTLRPGFGYHMMELTTEELGSGYLLLSRLLDDLEPPEHGKEAATTDDEQWNRYLEELLGDIDAKDAAKLSSELQIATSLARRHRQMGRIWSKDRLVATVRHLMSGNAEVSDSYLPADKPQTGQAS